MFFLKEGVKSGWTKNVNKRNVFFIDFDLLDKIIKNFVASEKYLEN